MAKKQKPTPAQLAKQIKNNPAAKKKVADAVRKNPAALAQVKKQMQVQAAMRQHVKEGRNPDGTAKGSPSGVGQKPTATPTQYRPPDATIAAVEAAMRKAGMGDIWGYVKNNLILRDGLTDANTIWMRMKSDTDKLPNGKTVAQTYADRFPANAERVKKGLPELTPVEYTNYEEHVQRMFSTALPGYKGFYDKKSDYTDLIANNVDPADLQERFNMAHEATQNADPGLVSAMQNMYGVGQNDLVAYFLDPNKAQQVIQRRYNAAQFNAAARKAGAQFSNQFAEEVAGQQGSETAQSVANTDNKALQGIADELAAARNLSGIYSADAVTDEDVARSAFNMQGAGAIDQRKKRLASQERGTFGGKMSADSGTLSERKNI